MDSLKLNIVFAVCVGLWMTDGVFAAWETVEKPWDDAVYYVESPDVLTVEFTTPIRYFACKNEVLREKMSVHLLAFDVFGNIACSQDFPIGPGGVVDLRELLGKKTAQFVVGDLTISEAEELLQSQFPESQRVILSTIIDLSRTTGNHLVEPDGYITLGDEDGYTRVYVNGLTVKEITEAIESALPRCEKGSVSVSVYAYNSKEYYVIFQGKESAQIYSFTCTGNETVLKAIANVNGLLQQPFSPKQVWIARPMAATPNQPQILLVDWLAVSAYGDPQTNHRILPGDQVVVEVGGTKLNQ